MLATKYYYKMFFMLVYIKKNDTLYIFWWKNYVNLFLSNESVLMGAKIYFKEVSTFLYKKGAGTLVP